MERLAPRTPELMRRALLSLTLSLAACRSPHGDSLHEPPTIASQATQVDGDPAPSPVTEQPPRDVAPPREGPRAPGAAMCRQPGASGAAAEPVAPFGPRGWVGGSSKLTAGRVPDADKTIRKARGKVNRCYLTTLRANPTLEGAVNYSIQVGSAGEVTGVEVTPEGDTLPSGLVDCIERELRTLRFAPPAGGQAARVEGRFALRHRPGV